MYSLRLDHCASVLMFEETVQNTSPYSSELSSFDAMLNMKLSFTLDLSQTSWDGRSRLVCMPLPLCCVSMLNAAVEDIWLH